MPDRRLDIAGADPGERWFAKGWPVGTGPFKLVDESFNRGRGDHRLGLYLALVTGTLSTGLGPRGRHCGRHRVASAALLLGSRQSILAGTAR